MSRINVHKVTTERRDGEREEFVIPPVHEGTKLHSLREGEELMAASAIIDAVDELDNGEAIVIIREIW
ncbi:MULTISPECIES: hypothetical protein [unclassified Streptomyces]|uniref:hypothetical protein n=1 Tax=unclassified Streptomyces TaxID=2593676 RepID=UPI003D7072BF